MLPLPSAGRQNFTGCNGGHTIGGTLVPFVFINVAFLVRETVKNRNVSVGEIAEKRGNVCAEIFGVETAKISMKSLKLCRYKFLNIF